MWYASSKQHINHPETPTASIKCNISYIQVHSEDAHLVGEPHVPWTAPSFNTSASGLRPLGFSEWNRRPGEHGHHWRRVGATILHWSQDRRRGVGPQGTAAQQHEHPQHQHLGF